MEPKKPKIIEKPWGREIWLAHEGEYAGKILEINKGARTSLQYHKVKKETIYVLEGELKVSSPDKEITVMQGESITLNPGEIHRLCPTDSVILIEVSTPELDDVVRLKDDYERVDEVKGNE